ncbi:MAG: histidinol dehydrogenase, partial [Clostridia bacterium]|nr:histidinol dehydrogenase [Clostridia bacterium]
MIRIYKYGEIGNDEIFSRATASADVSGVVAGVIADVRANGDKALFAYSEKFDKVKLASLEVSKEELEETVAKVDPEFRAILERAAANIRAFHEKQVRAGFVINEKDGVVLGQKIIPLETVGLYVPGGTASYPSSVLMNVIPAKIAGVKNILMVTPPAKDGGLKPEIVAAAKVAGVDRIFKVGGAQAIAALAYGTETIPRADKIMGPGNAYVAEAKKQVFGVCGIDMIAGPSEILIVADGKSDPRLVAADMLSQAEHDKMASAVLVTDSMELAEKTAEELERQLAILPREEIARPSIENNGKIIVAEDLDRAIDIANEIAPEHLEICTDAPFDVLNKIRNAGSVFLGRSCPEALGDYFAGPNHTLPTGGTARFSSPLSVDDYVKKYSFTYYTADALAAVTAAEVADLRLYSDPTCKVL